MIIETFFKYDWKIVIFYEVTCEDTNTIIEALKDINCPNKYIKEAINNLESCALNIGLTYSNLAQKSSIIVISKTSSFSQLINTISHEYFHLICHLFTALDIEDEEELAKLNGDLNMRSYEFVEKLQKKQVHQ